MRRAETTAGRLRTRITIVAPQRTDDGFGGFATTYGGNGLQWPAWAEKRYVSGGDTAELEQTQSRRRFTYRIRRRKDVTVTTAMRITDGALTLTIQHVAADDDDRSAQILDCTELALPPFVAAVDHITITPSSPPALAIGGSQVLAATVFDASNNALAGRVLRWSSSDPTVATVSSLGLVTAVGAGSCTITATCEGKTATVSEVVAVILTLTLDFAPLVRRSDLADPLVFVSNTGRSGYQDSVPQHTGAGLLNGTNAPARANYLKSAGKWGFVGIVDGPMSMDRVPDVSHVTTNTLIDGPYPNTGARSLVPNDAQHYAILDSSWNVLAAADNQDAATFKRSLACVLIAATPADVGKAVRINLIDSNNYPSGGNWNNATQPVIKFVDVTLTHSLAEVDHTAATALLWQHVALTFDSQAQQSAVVGQPTLALTMVPDSGNLVNYVVAPYQARSWQDEGDTDPSNWLRPMPFHETLGVASTDIYCNAWSGDSDLPTLLGGATRASTAIAAPDSSRYHGARTLSQYTLGVGDGITTSALVRLEDGGDSPPALTNVPVGSAWMHWYISPAAGHALPLDTDLAAYLIASGLVTPAEDTVQRADSVSSPGTMDTGQAWQIGSGTWGVLGNTLQLQIHAGDDYIYVDTGLSDCTVDTTLFAVGSDGEVTFRIVDANNRFRLLWEAGTLRIDKWVAGVFNFSIVSTTVALSPGDRVGVILSGNTISPTHNGTVIPALVITDAFNATATKHGLGAANSAPRYSHFKVSAQSAAAHTYGPFPLERDSTRYRMAFGSALVQPDGTQFFRCRPTFNLASEGYLDFTPKIVNASAGPLVFNAYRAAVTTEGGRGRGLHSAWVPKRTITGRSFADSCFETIPNIQTIMTTPTLLWVIRQVVPWSFGDLANINGAGVNSYIPSLWQSGPYGSADYVFHCDVVNNGDGTFYIEILVARGSPTVNPGLFMSWSMRVNNISLAQAAVAWPAMVAFDMAVAALNGVPQALGIGLGTGTGITWLQHGDSFLGGTVVFSHSAGTAWAFDGGLGTGPGLGHMGVSADLDRVRQTNGWFQAILAQNTLPSNLAGLKASIQLQLVTWGARKDHRLAL